jgi:hypothetical protein
MRLLETVVTPLERDGPLAGPHQSEHLDRLLQCVDGLARAAARTAHPGDLVEEATSAEAELEAAAAQYVHGRARLADHRGSAQRQVRDVGKERDPAGLGQQGGDQREGVQEASLVGVILDADELEPALVGHSHQLAAPVDQIGERDNRDADFGLVYGVHLSNILAAATGRPAGGRGSLATLE